MGSFRRYDHRYITRSRELVKSDQTPKGWIAHYCTLETPQRPEPTFHLEVKFNPSASKKELSDFISETMEDTVPWWHDVDPQECKQRILVYMVMQQMLTSGSGKDSEHTKLMYCPNPQDHKKRYF